MPTLNQNPLNVGPINGPALTALPDTEEICVTGAATTEIYVTGFFPAAWELQLTEITAPWELNLSGAVKEC